MKRSVLLHTVGPTVCGVLLTAVAALAQPSTGGPSPSTSTAVPLDGGASLVLATGVAYGLKRLRAVRATRP